MSELKRCSRCVIPETHETIHFDEKGVCNICRQHEFKKEVVDWDKKKKELDILVKQYRGKYDYDCIVPFSGGKDSTWTLYYLVKEYGLKPLVVRFDHGFLRGNVLENTRKVIRRLGVDFHNFTPNWHVVRKLMLQSFLEKGDFCWHCHTGIFSYPMQIAIKHNIPLLLWGEPSAEYTAYYSYDTKEEVDEKRFNRFVNLGMTAQDMLVRLEGSVTERDLLPFTYPSLEKLRRINYRSVCLGSYIPWDVRRQVAIIQKELGWSGDMVEGVPPGYEYEKIECYLQGVRDYIKYIKRGYTRPSHLVSLDIRNSRMSREDAMKMIEQYENKRPHALKLFLGYVGLTEKEFLEIAVSHSVSPYIYDASRTVDGPIPSDFDSWPRYKPMPRKVAEKQLSRWCQRRQGSLVNG